MQIRTDNEPGGKKMDSKLKEEKKTVEIGVHALERLETRDDKSAVEKNKVKNVQIFSKKKKRDNFSINPGWKMNRVPKHQRKKLHSTEFASISCTCLCIMHIQVCSFPRSMGSQPGLNTAGGGRNLFFFWATVAAILCSPFTLLVSPFPAFPGFWGNRKRVVNSK